MDDRVGCVLSSPMTYSADADGILIAFDTLLFGLTLSKTWSLHNSGLRTPLVSLLLRDGIAYFLYVHNVFIWYSPLSDSEFIQCHVSCQCNECHTFRGTSFHLQRSIDTLKRHK